MLSSQDTAALPRAGAVNGKPGAAVALLLSAHSPDALREAARQWASRLARSDTRLEDAAFHAAVRQDYFRYRFALTAASSAEAIVALDAFAREGAAPAGAPGDVPRSRRKIAFVFSGQGSQWLGMGRALLREPAFRAGIDGCDAVAIRIAGISVVDELLRPDAQSRLGNSCVGAIAVFSVQVAMASLWKAIGVVPDVVLGQSLGEVAAAHVAGALALEDAARVAVHRSLLMQRTAGKGRAAMIGLPVDTVARMLGAGNTGLWIAGTASPNSTIIAGDPRRVAEIVAALGQRGIFARKSRIDMAVHTPHMEPLVPELVAAVRSIRPRACSVPLVSSLKGGRVAGEELDAEFWGEHMRRPFLLSQAVSAAIDEGADLFLELSPHPLIEAPLAETLSALSCDAPVLASMRRDTDERRQFLATAGRLFTAGSEVSLEPFFARGRGER